MRQLTGVRALSDKERAVLHAVAVLGLGHTMYGPARNRLVRLGLVGKNEAYGTYYGTELGHRVAVEQGVR